MAEQIDRCTAVAVHVRVFDVPHDADGINTPVDYYGCAIAAMEWFAPQAGFSIPINEWLRDEGEQRLMDRMSGLPDVIDLNEGRRLVRGAYCGVCLWRTIICYQYAC